MRIVRFEGPDGSPVYGEELAGGQARLLQGDPLAGLIPTGETLAVVRRLAPIEPVNIFCIGLNYRAHAEETGAPLPENPVVFMKPTTALNHPDSEIRLPACCVHGPEVDYEAELAVVIGKSATNVSEQDALDHVLGYSCANDVSARRWQKHGGGGQWVRGKSFDSFCPLGPVLVTADEIADPQVLPLRTRLNGRTMQEGHTSDMIFPVAKLIHLLSQDTTLLPGTVILTGTPPGVGFARNPPVYLAPGDRIEVEIEGIGVLANSVVAAHS
ncbi:MAG: fumarylacetoacetate hydrolase family protein [Gammaproteobacteria bacterium]|nr:fumarylacetoacetate hydrolase family protein [Gammaproteobacteria bacterium]